MCGDLHFANRLFLGMQSSDRFSFNKFSPFKLYSRGGSRRKKKEKEEKRETRNTTRTERRKGETKTDDRGFALQSSPPLGTLPPCRASHSFLLKSFLQAIAQNQQNEKTIDSQPSSFTRTLCFNSLVVSSI